MELKQIHLTIQQLVSAIADVLKIEIEVSDANLIRVAGTGHLKRKIWKEMVGEDIVYRTCLEKKETIVVRHPGEEHICQSCNHFGNCQEFGEICSPIMIDQQVIGVIGFIAFNEQQKRRLFDDAEANILFLEKLAEIVATKLLETRFYRTQIMAQKKVAALFDYVQYGVVTFNEHGQYDYVNKMARTLLNLPDTIDTALLEQLYEHAKAYPTGQVITLPSEQKILLKYQRIQLDTSHYASMMIIEDPRYIQTTVKQLIATTDTQLIGQTSFITNMKHLAQKISYGNMPVLLSGEAGTGKGFIAKYIHDSSIFSSQPFEKVNCSFYSADALHTLFFGDASTNEPGKLATLGDGTLYIEEIEHMPQNVQVSLLKYLTDGLIYTNGQYVKQQTRIMASTHTIQSALSTGAFRRDLYYKLNVVPIDVPPLRERRDDILAFIHYFLDTYTDEQGPHKIDDDVQQILMAYDWPGNIREIANTMSYICHVEQQKIISKHSLPDFLRQQAATLLQQQKQTFDLRIIERQTILHALQEVEQRGLRKEDAAQLLGISRATLFRKINEYSHS